MLNYTTRFLGQTGTWPYSGEIDVIEGTNNAARFDHVPEKAKMYNLKANKGLAT